ncbi:hypothetical protein G7046_g981 [Stylonectria norvegica]|nr:hypothetical protein G7046_g981 [Stylonectria norvegica]
MEDSNSRRILAVGLEAQTAVLSGVVKGRFTTLNSRATFKLRGDHLTGKSPAPPATSLAGTTHPLHLKTAYYTTTVPIWLDLIASPTDWSSSFLSEEASDVLAVLGGLVVVFAVPSAGDETRTLIEQVGKVVKQGLGGWEWDGVGIAVGVGESNADDVEEWDEVCAEAGLEFVHVGGKQPDRNEFGEKTGIARVKEALEANDWTYGPTAGDLSDSDFGAFETSPDKAEEGDGGVLDPADLEFGFDKKDFEGMRRAIWEQVQPLDDDVDDADEEKKSRGTEELKEEDGKAGKKGEDAAAGEESEKRDTDTAEEVQLDEDEVAKVEQMMRKLHAVREAGEGMGEQQRRRLAARAVEEVMKEL